MGSYYTNRKSLLLSMSKVVGIEMEVICLSVCFPFPRLHKDYQMDFDEIESKDITLFQENPITYSLRS